MDYLYLRNTLLFGELRCPGKGRMFATDLVYSFLSWWPALNGGHSDNAIVNGESGECGNSSLL